MYKKDYVYIMQLLSNNIMKNSIRKIKNEKNIIQAKEDCN